MKRVQFPWRKTLLFGLIFFAQTLFMTSSVTAGSSSLETTNLLSKEVTSSAGLMADKWVQITRQIDPYYQQVAYLKADNVSPEDNFGRSAAIDGDTLVVGAPKEDTGGSNSGAAYVFVRSGTSWTQQAFLKASNLGSGDQFGFDVDVDGDTIVVGAYGEASNGSNPEDNSALQAGAAYVFVREGTDWTQQAYLKSDSPELGDQFGKAVAVDGDRIVVGVMIRDEAFVFERVDTAWTQQGYLTASNQDVYSDYFGCSVAISGDTIVVGAELERGNGEDPADNSFPSAGAAYVFVKDPKLGWTEQAYLKADIVGEGDNFGRSVAISGDTIVVGAPSEDSLGSNPEENSGTSVGAAYVFLREETSWTQQAYLKASIAENYDSFGHSVSIDGNNLVVSAIGKDDTGAVYVFSLEGEDWNQQDYLKASNAGIEDSFGTSNGVDISGDTILVGADYEDSAGSDPEDNSAAEAGAAYVFRKVFTFSGQVFAGAFGDESHPLSSVSLSLYCSDDPNRLGSKITSTVTDTAGSFELETFDVCNFYNIYEVDPEGYISIGASSDEGFVANENQIRYTAPLEGQNLSGSKFWDDLRKLYLPLILR